MTNETFRSHGILHRSDRKKQLENGAALTKCVGVCVFSIGKDLRKIEKLVYHVPYF